MNCTTRYCVPVPSASNDNSCKAKSPPYYFFSFNSMLFKQTKRKRILLRLRQLKSACYSNEPEKKMKEMNCWSICFDLLRFAKKKALLAKRHPNKTSPMQPTHIIKRQSFIHSFNHSLLLLYLAIDIERANADVRHAVRTEYYLASLSLYIFFKKKTKIRLRFNRHIR